MKLMKLLSLGALAGWTCVTMTWASLTFQGLGQTAGYTAAPSAISADGSTVVGTRTCSANYDQYEAFRWTATIGMQPLGNAPSTACGVNADGSVIVGTGWDGVTRGDGSGAIATEAYRWVNGSAQRLFQPEEPPVTGTNEDPTDGDPPPTSVENYSAALGASADGSIIAGATYIRAFRWTAAGIQTLDDLVDLRTNYAVAISHDGARIAGTAEHMVNTHNRREAFRWSSSGGTQLLGFLPGAGQYGISEARAMSGDGSTVVGTAIDTALVHQGFRWTDEGGMQGLGFLPGFGATDALAATFDGSAIVGMAYRYDGYNFVGEALLWDADGMHVLRELLVNRYGMDLDGWKLDRATGISADGLTIVGTGINPSGQHEAWIAVTPDPAALPLLTAAALAAVRCRRTSIRQTGIHCIFFSCSGRR